jgi:CHAT domain-containing protein
MPAEITQPRAASSDESDFPNLQELELQANQAIERLRPRKARLDAEDEGWRDLDDVAHSAFARGAALFDRESVQIAVDCFETASTHAHRRIGWLADYNLACALMLRRAFGGEQEDRERALSLFAGVVSRSDAETSFVHKTHKRIVDCVYDLQEMPPVDPDARRRPNIEASILMDAAAACLGEFEESESHISVSPILWTAVDGLLLAGPGEILRAALLVARLRTLDGCFDWADGRLAEISRALERVREASSSPEDLARLEVLASSLARERASKAAEENKAAYESKAWTDRMAAIMHDGAHGLECRRAAAIELCCLVGPTAHKKRSSMVDFARLTSEIMAIDASPLTVGMLCMELSRAAAQSGYSQDLPELVRRAEQSLPHGTWAWGQVAAVRAKQLFDNDQYAEAMALVETLHVEQPSSHASASVLSLLSDAGERPSASDVEIAVRILERCTGVAAPCGARCADMLTLGYLLIPYASLVGERVLLRAVEVFRDAQIFAPHAEALSMAMQGELRVLPFAAELVSDAEALQMCKRACHLAEHLGDAANVVASASAQTKLSEITLDPVPVKMAIAVLQESHPDMGDSNLLPLAVAYRVQAHVTGQAAYYDDAVRAHEDALAQSPDTAIASAHRVNLAAALRERWEARGRGADAHSDLERAIELGRDVISELPSWRVLRQDAENNLGMALTHAGELTEDPSLLLEAIEIFRNALSVQVEGSSGWCVILGNFALTCFSLYMVTETPEARQRAIAALWAVLPFSGPLGRPRSLHLAHLGWLLLIDGSPTEQANGVSFLEACTLMYDDFPSSAMVQTGALLTRHTFEKFAWGDTISHGSRAIDAIERLVDAQLSRGDQEIVLKHASPVGARVAYAASKLGDPRAAVLELERSRGFMLRHALRLDDTRHSAADTTATNTETAAITARLRALTHADVASPGGLKRDLVHEIRRLREALDAAQEATSPVHATWDDIHACCQDGDLCYVASTEHGTVALQVSTEHCEAIFLPLSEDKMRHRVLALLGAYHGRAQHARKWLKALDETLGWLWTALAGPLYERLAGRRVTFIPVGLLGCLPLHAAWRADRGQPGGRLYLGQSVCCAYAPVVDLARDVRGPLKAPRVALAVGDPQPSELPALPASAAEAQFVHDTIGDGILLLHDEATRSAVISAAGEVDLAHFACHAHGSHVASLEGGLALSNGDVISVREVLAGVCFPRVVVLSACDTATRGLDLPDEAIGLTTAMLQSGTQAVVSSFWSVPDESTYHLMRAMYRYWCDGESLARSLQQAQYEMLTGSSGLFAEPQHWAAFSLHGFT